MSSVKSRLGTAARAAPVVSVLASDAAAEREAPKASASYIRAKIAAYMTDEGHGDFRGAAAP